MIPIPPWLLGLVNPLKPFGDFLASALRNPYVVGALVALIAVLFWRHEEGRVLAANARVAKVDAEWRGAFQTESRAFLVVDGALKRQNLAVAALGAAGRAETAKASQGWAKDRKALDASLAAAESRPAPDPKGDPAAEADTIFRASREGLR